MGNVNKVVAGIAGGSGAYDGKYTTAQRYAPVNGAQSLGAGTTTGTILFYANYFVMPSAGVVSGIGIKGIGNGGNSGNPEELEWAILKVEDGVVAEVIGSGTLDILDNTFNTVTAVTGLSVSVPEQFVMGIIGVAGGQFNADTLEGVCYPGIPTNTGQARGALSATRVTFDPPVVGGAMNISNVILNTEILWAP